MGLKNTYQSRKKFTKTPVKSTGMWYQDGDVIVPSNQITMKGPQGQSDYFNSPILGVGMQSGETQIMQPGREYLFPNDNSVFETKMQNGGLFSTNPATKLSSSDEEKFSQFFATLPSNLKVDDNFYDIRGYWDALGRPNAFDYSQPKEDDDMYHAFSRHPRSGKMLKSMSHPTAQMAIEEDKAAGYSHAMDPSGNVYSFSLDDMPTEGPYSFKDGGEKVRFPKFKSFLRTSPADNYEKYILNKQMQNGGLFPVGPYDEMMAPKQGNYLLPDINRPSYIDDEGGRRSEYRLGINIDGKETLLPTVVGGRQLTDEQAEDQYMRTGLHMGKFKTPEESEYQSRLRTAKYNMLVDPIRYTVDQFKSGGLKQSYKKTKRFKK